MDTAVIGGGASGMIAAICAAQNGSNVTIFEHMPRMGRKLLLTGSGKCNISNTDMDISHFHSEDTDVVRAVLDHCTPAMTKEFFEKTIFNFFLYDIVTKNFSIIFCLKCG